MRQIEITIMMIDLNLSISIITIGINDLNIPNKIRDCHTWQRKWDPIISSKIFKNIKGLWDKKKKKTSLRPANLF